MQSLICRQYAFLVVVGVFLLTSNVCAAEKAPKPFTVVIDAGHGGKDPGALGKIVQEKTLNLSVALRLQQLINDSFPEVKVVQTRSSDVFLPLQERADIVNKNNADLFICIHTNSAESSSAIGAETFVLGVNKLESNLDVAMRENSVMLLEADYQTKYQGFDPNSVESYIMFEFMQDTYIDQSLQFAQLVQNQLVSSLSRHDRGVRQAGFWVLHKSACPSVLIEMGFISNREEEKFMASEQGKESIARSIFAAFSAYKQSLNKTKTSSEVYVDKELEAFEAKRLSVSSTQDDAAHQQVAAAARAKREEPKPEKSVAKEKQIEPLKEPVKEPVKEEVSASKPMQKKEPQVEAKPTKQVVEEVAPKAVEASRLVYRVQIFAVKKQLPESDPEFKGLKGCYCLHINNYYKYMYGCETDYEAIDRLCGSLREKFKDCFVVALLDGAPISVKEARAMSSVVK